MSTADEVYQPMYLYIIIGVMLTLLEHIIGDIGSVRWLDEMLPHLSASLDRAIQLKYRAALFVLATALN